MADWSKSEVDLIIPVYFEMLKKELSGQEYNKTEYRKSLLSLLPNRTHGAIEFKHQNISAALVKLSLPYIKGYKPRYHYQQILDEKVIGYINENLYLEQLFHDFVEGSVKTKKMPLFHKLFVKPPKYEELQESLPFYGKRPIKINYLEKEQNNSRLGFLGEELVYKYEKWSLNQQGRDDLAKEIVWVSKENGDGAGFDILSKTPSGEDKYIEVKTTRLGIKTPFFFSRNEFDFSNENAQNYFLYRLFDFDNQPKAFSKNGGLENICRFTPVSYKGYF